MKSPYSIHLSTAKSWRGGENQIWLLTKGLQALGHKVLVLAPKDARQFHQHRGNARRVIAHRHLKQQLAPERHSLLKVHLDGQGFRTRRMRDIPVS